MRKYQVSLILIIGFLVVGCVSVPNANGKRQTLLIGQIVMDSRGWSTAYASINGNFTTGIEITIQNIESGKKYTTRSQLEGIFLSAKIPKGTYRITKLYLKKEFGNSWRSVWWEPRGREFEIIEGYVNNMGILDWYCENNSPGKLTANKEYEQVRNAFQEKVESSNWNEKEWINVPIAYRY